MRQIWQVGNRKSLYNGDTNRVNHNRTEPCLACVLLLDKGIRGRKFTGLRIPSALLAQNPL